jgi:uncharacterized membrane protein
MPQAIIFRIPLAKSLELSPDARDFIAIHLLRTSMLSTNTLFASMFLPSHGATKVILIVALWSNAL